MAIRHGSNPADIDSDDDSYGPGISSPYPSLWDGGEVLSLRTSPILSDRAYDAATRSFWWVQGTPDGLSDSTLDVEELLLRAGDYLLLTFYQDQDGDKLFDREERFYGTDPLVADTDLDAFDDYQEARSSTRSPIVTEWPGQFVAQVVSDRNELSTHTTLVRLTNGTLWAMGTNSHGALGLGDAYVDQVVTLPTLVGTDTDWAWVSTGGDRFRRSSAAIKTDGTLWTWGSNDFGQLGIGSAQAVDESEPVQVGTASNWRTVEVGATHVVAIKTDGTLWSWGYGGRGRLGFTPNPGVTCPDGVNTPTVPTLVPEHPL